MPSVSPSAPISRTSFALISSLSRFSLSFALIVQHLQAKKIPYKDTVSARLPLLRNLAKGEVLSTHRHNRCVGESGALCFVLLAYYTTFLLVCQEFFRKYFSLFSFAPNPFSIFLYDTKCPLKIVPKKAIQMGCKFYLLCIFTNFFADFRHN